MKENCLFVILGATGDLTRKKLIPAMYNILKNRQLENFAVVGMSFDKATPASLIAKSRKYIKNPDNKILSRLKNRLYYFQADFYDKKKFRQLEDFVEDIEKKHGLKGNRLFYLATLPKHFEVIALNLAKCRLTRKKRSTWKRVVFEKPFGEDLRSARHINRCIKKVFRENQIYRIDHYLGKELVQNISVVRFTNTILEPLWSSKYIDHVQIVMTENFGVETRGAFYDKYGALKDVVQNHLLQLVALAAMEPPKLLTEKHIRDEKLKILKSIILTKDVVLGQYNGYKKEKGVKKNSGTETFAALRLNINNKRWKNAPFYIITGKNMDKRIASIYVQFKDAPCLLFKGICNFMPNYLVIQIQPEEGFYMQLNAKVPGKTDIAPVKMDFCHECTFGPNSPEAYENLLIDVIEGDQSVFVRSDEIEEAWKIVDKVSRRKIRPQQYKKGSYPEKAKKLIQKDNRYWHLKVK